MINSNQAKSSSVAAQRVKIKSGKHVNDKNLARLSDSRARVLFFMSTPTRFFMIYSSAREVMDLYAV
jgi:hypothetical protein